ncbi:uncharacterized protein LOC144139225 [Haemaphysalis longicornis]
MINTKTLLAILATLSAALARRPVPRMGTEAYECFEWTAVLSICGGRRLQSPRYREAWKVLSKENTKFDIQDCLIRNAPSVPDRIYCTDETSARIVARCVNDPIQRHYKMSDRISREFSKKLETCIGEYHKNRKINKKKKW